MDVDLELVAYGVGLLTVLFGAGYAFRNRLHEVHTTPVRAEERITHAFRGDFVQLTHQSAAPVWRERGIDWKHSRIQHVAMLEDTAVGKSCMVAVQMQSPPYHAGSITLRGAVPVGGLFRAYGATSERELAGRPLFAVFHERSGRVDALYIPIKKRMTDGKAL